MGLVHDKLKQKLAGSRQQFGWKPKDGDNRVFILPPGARFVGNGDPAVQQQLDETVETLAYQFRAHYFKIPGRQGEATRCLQDFKQACPVCAMHHAYVNTTDPGLKEMAKQIKQTDQYIFNILDLNDLAKGVQRWGANWTCWTKIMEVASNPAWGYVFDPLAGRPFIVTLTPEAKSRTGYNSYSVLPEPQQVSVFEVLMAQPTKAEALDGLEEAAMAVKTPEEIATLLDEMNFPPLGAARNDAAPPIRGAMPLVRPITTAAAPSVLPTPMVMPVGPTAAAVAAPAPMPIPVHAGSAPAPVVTAIGAPAVVVAATPTPGIYFDPGPGYVEKVPADQRPTGAPRCFGDYEPRLRPCQPCPVMSACQMKLLGVA